MTVIEAILPLNGAVDVTVTTNTPVGLVPSRFVAVAVIAVTPGPIAVTTPVPAFTVATPGLLDAQTTVGFGTVASAPEVPVAVRFKVAPPARGAGAAGLIAIATSGSDEPVTAEVYDAVPVTTVVSGLIAAAVIAAEPVLTAVMAAPGFAVATCGLLELHVAG
jgi:hypothetical protein